MSAAKPPFAHFRLMHRLTRRVRILAPALVRAVERCTILDILLRKHAGVTEVRCVPDIGSVVIQYDPAQLPEPRLLATLDAVIGNLARTPLTEAGSAAVPKVIDGPQSECSLAIEGMTCASCALLVEMRLRRDPRISQANVNFAAASVSVRGALGREQVIDLIAKVGYTARPMDTLAQRRWLVENERARLETAKQKVIKAALLTVPVMVSGMAMHHNPALRVMELALSSLVLFDSSRDIFHKAWKLAQQGEANMDTLIAIGAGAAWGYSLPGVLRPQYHVYFESAAGICTFVLLGRYLEERAKGKASEAIRKLIELQPDTAWRVGPDGHEEAVPIDDVVVGDLLRVRAGDKIPTDGVVTEGQTTVNEAMMTGESVPVPKGIGDALIGGCLNGTGSVLMRVTAVGGNTVLSGIVRLVDHAQGSKLPVQKLADRISARFVPAVGGIAAATLAGWLWRGHPLSSALANAVAVLLIACPCALGLATPTAIMVGTGQAARRGIYIRNGEALETTAQLDTLVFDKTGTITEGRPVVTDACLAESVCEAELAPLIAAAEAGSEHFLARALGDWCRSKIDAVASCADFTALPGRGVAARIGTQLIRIGNAELLAETGVPVPESIHQQAQSWATEGKTPVYVALDTHWVALFAVADQPRSGVSDVIAHLRAMGLKTVMATGDVDAVAQHVARQVGIDRVHSRATPADKLALIQALQAEGHKVGMIGDGINDAPALAAANVGFAIGGGADIAVESADVTLVGGDIARVTGGVELSRRTMRIIRQNLFWALGYNVVAIPFAAAGRLNPMIAAAAMALSSVSVISNSLRLQRD